MLVLGNWINCAWFRPLTLNIQTNPEWLHYGEIVPGISLELVCAFRSRASCAAITETAAWRRTKSIEEKCLCTIFSYQVVFCPIGFLQYWSARLQLRSVRSPESFFNICLGLSILDGTSPLVEWGWPASHSKIISIKENKQLVSSERDSVIREWDDCHTQTPLRLPSGRNRIRKIHFQVSYPLPPSSFQIGILFFFFFWIIISFSHAISPFSFLTTSRWPSCNGPRGSSFTYFKRKR